MYLKSKTVLQILLSLFLLYHFTGMMTLPNKGSYLTANYGYLFSGYANTLGLNASWNFFSPNPSRHFYLEYEPVYGDLDIISPTHQWPPEWKGTALLWDNYLRLLYHSLFTSGTEQQVKTYLGDYLCRKYPDAISFDVQKKMVDVPPLERVIVSSRPLTELIEERVVFSVGMDCGVLRSKDAEEEP